MATIPPEWPRWEVGEVVGYLHGASNATLFAHLVDGTPVVYKPVRGETPLWDFPEETLAAREVLAHTVSERSGLAVVPETRWAEGPYGPGSAQRFVDEDPALDQRALLHPVMDARLWPIAVLDVVTNNADRKLGHVLPTTDGRLWAIDNALTFHPEAKLRTVLWGFAGRPLPNEMVEVLERLVGCLDELEDVVGSWLGPSEATMLRRRVLSLRTMARHPEPPVDRPPLPWPVW